MRPLAGVPAAMTCSSRCPLIRMTGTPGRRRRRALSVSQPFMPGMVTSQTTQSKAPTSFAKSCAPHPARWPRPPPHAHLGQREHGKLTDGRFVIDHQYLRPPVGLVDGRCLDPPPRRRRERAGKIEPERAASTRRALHADGTLPRPHHAQDHGQPEPAAHELGRKERIKNLVHRLRFDAAAGVGDLKTSVVCRRWSPRDGRSIGGRNVARCHRRHLDAHRARLGADRFPGVGQQL
jgi:hypothetical protein